MKKYLVVLLVLAMATYASAGTCWLQVDPDDAETSYAPSDIITIQLVADADATGYMLDSTRDNVGNLTAQSVSHNASWGAGGPGTVVNDGTVLTQWASGTVSGTGVWIDAGESLWEMEYHIPDVPDSTWITLSADLVNALYFMYQVDFLDETQDTTIDPVEIHVTPEPMTIALLGLGGLFLRRRK